VLGDLAVDPQLSAAINQTPECQNLTGTDATTRHRSAHGITITGKLNISAAQRRWMGK
jgi:hypothetical protein